MNFTENCMKFMERWNEGENHRFRSYDYCKNLFDKYYQKVLDGATLTNEEKDYFALNLFCYLASWGMLRGSGWLLGRSYKFFIPLCEVLFDRKYKNLRTTDPLRGNYNASEVVTLHDALDEKIKNILQNDNLEDKKASRLMLCKIMMGTYGCVIAYDDYDIKGLAALGVHTNSAAPLSEKLLEDTYGIIIDHKEEFEKIMKNMETYIDPETKKPVNYTVFKVLDMILWIYGENIGTNKSEEPMK